MYFCHVCQRFYNQQEVNDAATSCAVCHSPLIEVVQNERQYRELQAIVRAQQVQLQEQQEQASGNFLEDLLPLLPRLFTGNPHDHIVISFSLTGAPEMRSRPRYSVDELMDSFETLPNGLQEGDRCEYPEAFLTSSCAICLESVIGSNGPVVVLPCRHCFHKDCIKHWLAEHLECPLCRANVVPPQGMAAPLQSREQRPPEGGEE
ncbi:hypothetical protein TraAM80_02726 [Trypanosoma rangeli]|uniref:RING-type domain-containing protein n=1 Tax=Trypanosoma rangeli TaxID=5698 RepID=A0A3R7M3S8_TRYRA|nr:uncharacterized protein TraAM80_02726 [Trypanosoma rangeli]RNF08500.1 hypothetical protein TraAM80_02726 [Trypanosoma rangeli]|eukprot:RNF08500.1 hypothetical protein TraAM80_02726 [Trypanosoma rangeli]